MPSMGRHAADDMDEALGESTADVLLTKPSILVSGTFHFYGICRKKESRRADSNRLPLLQLRVITQALQGFAQGCDCSIPKRFSLPPLARRCTVLRSRWCQIGIRTSDSYSLTVRPMARSRALRSHNPPTPVSRRCRMLQNRLI